MKELIVEVDLKNGKLISNCAMLLARLAGPFAPEARKKPPIVGQTAGLQLCHAFQNRGPRHARQPRETTDRSASFFQRLLGDKDARLRLIQRAEHTEPVSLDLRKFCL